MKQEPANNVANALLAGNEYLSSIFNKARYCCEHDGYSIFVAVPRDEFVESDALPPIYVLVSDSESKVVYDGSEAITSIVVKKQSHSRKQG